MTFTGVVVGVAIAAIVLTTALYFATKRVNNFILSFLQNFCGILFLFSGYVKAIDPLGTAFKMEQYFAEFKGTFEETSMSFLADLFPVLSDYSIGFSVVMIVLEMIVGLMLVIGARKRLASWIFLILILFFTALTGFTYLTGYVPSGVNFFQFGQWGDYQATNMKVTDCGCFGDFLKIEPKMSFLKDVVLLFPALVFVFKTEDMHTLFTRKARNGIVGISTIALIWYCLSNFSWDLPHTDFRPFRETVNIRDQRQAEMDAANNVEVIGFVLRNKEDGKLVELSRDDYFANFAEYPKTDWEVAEQIKTEPALKSTKLSEFIINDVDGYEISDDLLGEPGYSFWIISYKLPFSVEYEKVTRVDTVFAMDTILVGDDDPIVVKRALGTKEVIEEKPHYSFDQKAVRDYQKELLPLIEESGIKTIAMIGGMSAEPIAAFREKMEISFPVYEADDILLKTMIRSNPGLILMHDGVVVKKWHKAQLPTAAEIETMTSTKTDN